MPKPKPEKIKYDDALKEKHKGHENHICELVRKRDMHKVARLVRNSKYICLICGRTAADAGNLCLPVEI
jgi:hypothetical protein